MQAFCNKPSNTFLPQVAQCQTRAYLPNRQIICSETWRLRPHSCESGVATLHHKWGRTVQEPAQDALSAERRAELLGMGFPDDGYDYLNHMRAPGRSGRANLEGGAESDVFSGHLPLFKPHLPSWPHFMFSTEVCETSVCIFLTALLFEQPLQQARILVRFHSLSGAFITTAQGRPLSFRRRTAAPT